MLLPEAIDEVDLHPQVRWRKIDRDVPAGSLWRDLGNGRRRYCRLFVELLWMRPATVCLWLPDVGSGYPAIRACAALRIPTLAVFGRVLDHTALTPAARQGHRRALLRGLRCAVTSGAGQKILGSMLGVPAATIAVLREGFPAPGSGADRMERRRGWGVEEDVIVCCRCESAADVTLLWQVRAAWARVGSTHPAARLIVVTTTELVAKVSEIIGGLPEERCVSLVTGSEEMEAGFAGADVALIPRADETFPAAILNAAAQGAVSVAAGGIPGSDEYARPGEHYFEYETGDVGAMRTVLERALASREQWPALLTRARDRGADHTEIAAHADLLTALALGRAAVHE